MARTPKTQWDFGELFPAAETRKVWSVSDLTVQVKRTLERDWATVWVRGEISNLRLQSSGHAYFVLKDASAQLQCVLFRGQSGMDRSALRDGAQVLLGGGLTVYEPRGQYQLRVTHLEVQGVGALQAAFERLKLKLQAEGLFEASRKRPVPRYPRRLGIITSPTGAALRDVLHVIERRFAGLELIHVPSRVQGEGAATDVVDALERLNRWSAAAPPGAGLDVILLTRGGGSLEDLWTFNEEAVARAVAASTVPVVSAIGHEIDFTIVDFVADLRAATPSAAAEILTQSYVASREQIESVQQRMAAQVQRQVSRAREAVVGWQRRLGRVHPRRRLEEQSQRLDELDLALRRGLRRQLQSAHSRWEQLTRRLLSVRPSQRILRQREALLFLLRRLPAVVLSRWQLRQHQLDQLAAKLHLLSPQSALDRGYSITRDAQTGQVIREVHEVAAGQVLRTRVRSGEFESTVTTRHPVPGGQG